MWGFQRLRSKIEASQVPKARHRVSATKEYRVKKKAEQIFLHGLVLGSSEEWWVRARGSMEVLNPLSDLNV
jgi:hypothetical protein